MDDNSKNFFNQSFSSTLTGFDLSLNLSCQFSVFRRQKVNSKICDLVANHHMKQKKVNKKPTQNQDSLNSKHGENWRSVELSFSPYPKLGSPVKHPLILKAPEDFFQNLWFYYFVSDCDHFVSIQFSFNFKNSRSFKSKQNKKL